MAIYNLGRIDGLSAYEVWLDNGNEGTEEEFLASLKGDKGDTGDRGPAGADGFSPTATVEQTSTGAKITITDKNGTTTATVNHGKDGEGGGGGSITSETDPVYTADKPNIALKSEIPTNLSDLLNDVGYITDYTETDPTVPAEVKAITSDDISNWNNKAEKSEIPDVSNLANKNEIPKLVTLTQAEYDELVNDNTVDDNTYYFIKE